MHFDTFRHPLLLLLVLLSVQSLSTWWWHLCIVSPVCLRWWCLCGASLDGLILLLQAPLVSRRVVLMTWVLTRLSVVLVERCLVTALSAGRFLNM